MIETLTYKELLENTKSLRGKEKELMHKLLLHFGEVDERKLYRDAGYPSLFIYLHEGLKYSRAGAYRRQVASQAVRKHPELIISFMLSRPLGRGLCGSIKLIKSERAPASKFCVQLLAS